MTWGGRNVAYNGSLALEENKSEVGEAVLGRCIGFPASAPVPSISTACNGSFWERISGFLLLVEWGVAGSIPGRTNCERAWNAPGLPLHGFSVQL